MKLQAKHIPEDGLLLLVKSLSHTSRIYRNNSHSGYTTFETASASLFDIQKLWDNVPPKLILAKLRNLVKKGLLDGCACGCRGDFTIINKEES